MISRRQEVAREIGLVKVKDGLSVKDPARERAVIRNYESRARAAGLDPSLGKSLAEQLISISVVEQSRKGGAKTLKGRRALVVGGAGRMGEWTCRFLSTKGAEVVVSDTRGSPDGYANIRLIPGSIRDIDLVVIASPPGKCPGDLEKVLECRPKGLVFDLCSVKSHIAGRLQRGVSGGVKVTSVHPMFGPSAASPRGRNVIICRCGSKKADVEAGELFRSAGANVSYTSLDRHDELMAYVLGLSHLCTLLFAGTLAKSGKDSASYEQVQGPSFARLRSTAVELSNESRRVYHDIQALNPNTKHVIASMEDVLRELRRAALDDDPAKFRKIMDSDKEYLEVS